jgi:TATA-box binding protein (TBP) (component of TFIID and TFIIIB)
MYKLTISNIVCNANAGYRPTDLARMAYCKYMKLDPAVFPAAVSKPYYPRTSNSTFRSAEFVIAESKTEEEALLSAYSFVYDMTRFKLLSPNANVYSFLTHNIVCYTKMPRALDLHRFERDHPTRCTWQPKLFVGLHWIVKEMDKVVFVLFKESGNVVVAGIRKMEDIEKAEKLLEHVAKYMVKEGEVTPVVEDEPVVKLEPGLVKEAKRKVEQAPPATEGRAARAKKAKLQTMRI